MTAPDDPPLAVQPTRQLTAPWDADLVAGDGDGVPSTASSQTTLFLSLFLILLTFFIALVSMAEVRRDRQDEVAGSIRETFRREGSVQPVLAREGVIGVHHPVLVALAGAIETLLPVTSANPVLARRRMELSLPTAALFVEGRPEVQAGRLALLSRVAQALADAPDGEIIRVEALLGVMPGASLPPGGLALRRAGSLARALVAEGAPARAVAPGFLPGASGTVVLRFAVLDTAQDRVQHRALSGMEDAP